MQVEIKSHYYNYYNVNVLHCVRTSKSRLSQML